MQHETNSKTWTMLASIGFILAAVGIVIQWRSGISEAKVPVGAIILVVLAGLMWLRQWRWVPWLGVALSTFILIMAFIIGGVVSRLAHPADMGAFVGTLLQMVGLVTGIGAGLRTALHHGK